MNETHTAEPGRDDGAEPLVGRMKRRDWLLSRSSNRFGQAKDVYDGLVDVVLYSLSGDRIGRESPAFDGPKGFEPACEQSDWVLLAERPRFPVQPWDLDAMRAQR
jgi:hypothetical protein